MKVLGIVLVIVGLIAGIASVVTQRSNAANPVGIVGDQNQAARDRATSLLFPIMAGVAIAAGGVLIGLGMSRFAEPTIVPSDSPNAERAATTRDPSL